MVQQLISGLKGSGGIPRIRGDKMSLAGDLAVKGKGKGFDDILKGMMNTPRDKLLSGARIKNGLAAKTAETRRLPALRENGTAEAEMTAAAALSRATDLLRSADKNRLAPEQDADRISGRETGAGTVKNTREKPLKTVDAGKGDKETAALLTSAFRKEEPAVTKNPEGSDRDLRFTVEDRRSPFAKQTGGSQEKNNSGSRDRKGDAARFGGTEPNREPRVTEAVFSVKDVREARDTAEVSSVSRSRSAELLDRYLKVRGNEEIAKNINFIVKDSGMGEIHLTLQPETLGKVRINLRMEENRIVGHVIVDSNQVREIFLDNIQAISRMLEEQGYSQTSLDVSVDERQMAQNGNREDSGKSYHEKYSERLKTAGETDPVRTRTTATQSRLDLIA